MEPFKINNEQQLLQFYFTENRPFMSYSDRNHKENRKKSETNQQSNEA